MDFFIKINLIIEKLKKKSKNCCFSTAHAQGAEFRRHLYACFHVYKRRSLENRALLSSGLPKI